MYLPWSPVAVGLYVLVESAGVVPNIDIGATCRAAHKAVTAIIKDAQAADIDSCIRQQRDAREILIKGWAKFPAADRARCINPHHYMPSYVEWLVCLENAQAVRDIRKQK